MQLRVAHHLIESAFHEVQQALVDLALAPEESLSVLNPLKVAHGHAACIAENVRNREDAFGIDDRVGLPGGWTIGPFAENFGLYLVGISLGDLVFDGCGDGDVARLEQYIAC